MSPVEIPKLTPAAPIATLRAREGQTPGAGRAAGPAESPAPSAEGVRIELGAAALAGEAPADSARVQEIRQALREGTYPIMPTRIADALIAARFMLGYGQ